IFLAWGARGPEFKSRRPDQIPQRVTDISPPQSSGLESNWSPNVDAGRTPSAHTKNTAPIRGTSLIPEKPAIPDIFNLSYGVCSQNGISGTPENPDIDPTFPAKNPTFGRRQGCETPGASPVHLDTQNSRCSRSSIQGPVV